MSAACASRGKKATEPVTAQLSPAAQRMKLLDARRYTGPNVVWRHAGAVLDIECTPGEAERLAPAWQAAARQLLDAVGWHDQQTAAHRFVNGVALALSAPVDVLYAAVELGECAFAFASARLSGDGGEDIDAMAARLRVLIEEEVNPALLALRAASIAHGVAFLSDDDQASVGHGRGARVWPVSDLPAPDDVDWPALHDVPVGLVTGTNGKTTSVRMAAAIARAAGRNVGMTSTDGVAVNDRVIDHGDYSGPGGARAALRDPAVDIAILETARGGLLRRGLGVEHADAALITNIAEDHLGDFGSSNLDELLAIKWVVTSALDKRGHAVLNADDVLLVVHAHTLDCPIVWFSLDPNNATLSAHCDRGGQAMSVVNGALAHFDGNAWHELCAVSDIPLTMNGAARHNIANALGAAALTHALGIDYDQIVTGLCEMTAADNPGRCNVFDIDGVDVLLDFAHNPQGMDAIFELAAQRPAKRRLLAFAQAGDRTDRQIRELAKVAWKIGLDRVVVSELPKYYRGRAPGEVFALLRDELIDCGARPEQVGHFETEIESLGAALDWARPGDLVIMLALADTHGVLAQLQSLAAG